MAVKEFPIRARSLLRESRKVDPWFLGSCGMNLYRGCSHDCAYCDGRAEKYRVQGSFGEEVGVKENSLELLERELSRAEGRAPCQPELWQPGADGVLQRRRGFVVLGGGVGDSYQPLEEKYCLARGALEILAAHGLPVHVLTKSTLVLRDADVLERINRGSRAVVSFSISSAGDEVCSAFEPGAPPASERLGALATLKARGIPCGVFLLPVIPFVTDSRECIEESVGAAAAAGADFVLFGGMTLKPGRQMAHFLDVLEREVPGLLESVRGLYPGDPYGAALGSYYRRIGLLFGDAARGHGVVPRMPPALFEDLVEDSDRAAVLREHARAFKDIGMPVPDGWRAARQKSTPPQSSFT